MLVRGRVIDTNSLPVADAIVHDTRNAITTGSDGMFELETDSDFISADAAGYYGQSVQALSVVQIVLDANPDETDIDVIEIAGKLVKKKKINIGAVLLVFAILLFIAYKLKWIS